MSDSEYSDDENYTLQFRLNEFLKTIAYMIQSYNDGTRFGDFLVERLDIYLDLIKQFAIKSNVPLDYESYKNLEDYIEWRNCSKNVYDNINNFKPFIKKILTKLSNDYSDSITYEMCSNILLLHEIFLTIDLYHNKIDGFSEILTHRQIKLLQTKKVF